VFGFVLQAQLGVCVGVMGCIQSSDAIEDWESSTYGGGGSAANGEVYVFVPGFRAPKNVELAAHLLLQQQASSSSISPELATRLVSLRSRISHLAAKPDRSSSHKSRHADDEQGNRFINISSSDPPSNSDFSWEFSHGFFLLGNLHCFFFFFC
jgi:hypothetical protein